MTSHIENEFGCPMLGQKIVNLKWQLQMTIKGVGRLGPDLKTLFMYGCQDLTLRKAKKLILNM